MLAGLISVVLLSIKSSVSLYCQNEKSSKLKNIFSSPREGLTNIFQVKLDDVMKELKVINSNVLYVTYRIDKLIAKQQTLDAKEFYDDGPSDNNSESD